MCLRLLVCSVLPFSFIYIVPNLVCITMIIIIIEGLISVRTLSRDRRATSARQAGDMRATGARQAGDRRATGARQAGDGRATGAQRARDKRATGARQAGDGRAPVARLFHIMLKNLPTMPFSNAAKCSLLCH